MSKASIAMPDRERARQRDLKELQSCHDDAKFTDLAISCLFRHFNPCTRLVGMSDVLPGKSKAVIHHVFLKVLPSCDEVWGHKEMIIRAVRALQTADGGTDDYDRQDREALDALPDVITVFRGCSRDRILGLSWSLDRETARSFAIGGHHDVPIYDPVLVTAEIHKNNIFALLLHMRPEAKVLCEPTIISIEPIKV